MLPLLLPDDVRRLDRACNEVLGISPLNLMEHASRSATTVLHHILEERDLRAKSFLIACGKGNNGGDGLCIARMISTDDPNVHVTVVCDLSPVGLTEQSRVNLDRLPPTVEIISFSEVHQRNSFDVIIDALIGIGGGADLREPISSYCNVLNGLVGLKVAIDVPTGLDADTGSAHPSAFVADVTITIEAEKPGFFRRQGPNVTGRVLIAPMGLPENYAFGFTSVYRYNDEDETSLFPRRERSSSKFDNGRVLVIGGTRSMRGAPSLTAHAAISIGAGLVELAAPFIHPLTPREVMTYELPSNADGTISMGAESTLRTLLLRSTVCAIGPGLGNNPNTLQMLARLIDEVAGHKPVVIDADGLRLFEVMTYRGPNVVLTPHRGEFARLLSTERNDLPENLLNIAADYARNNSCILHVKDVPSVTTNGDINILTVNGSPAMATAGSGDVLTGIIAGCAAQGLSTFQAASLGAYLHAKAGSAAEVASIHKRIVAGDIIRYL